MNSLSRTEFRPMSDRQAQARLERMLANRRAAEAKRAARFAKPSKADETNDARWELVLAVIFAALLTPLVAALAGWLLPIVWRL